MALLSRELLRVCRCHRLSFSVQAVGASLLTEEKLDWGII